MSKKMSPANQWEVVGKNKKPTKSTSNVSNKSQKKQNGTKIVVEPNAPLKEDRTIYTVLLEKEEKKNKANASSGKGATGNSKGNENQSNLQQSVKKPVHQKKKKSENDSKKEKVISLDAAISKIDRSELESVLQQSQLRFPENPEVWMKDIASYLNLKLEKISDSEPTFSKKPQGYPLNQLPQGCEKVLLSFVKKFPANNLDNLYYHCIQVMMSESTKGVQIVGYKIFLQLLAQHKPDIALSKMPQYLELLKTHQNRPALCLSLLWVLGQCGLKSFKCGLKVWLDLMLPALELRQVANYPVEYLEKLVKGHKKMSNGYGVVTLREYFQVLDVVFSPTFNISNDLKRRLVNLYPHIKTLAYGDMPSHNLRTFFPSYLTRYKKANGHAINEELLECLVNCLLTDKQSFSVWCQLYTNHLVASGYLLEYISDNWTKLSQKFDKKLLKETLRSFSVTNEQMEAKSRNRDGLGHCQAGTKDLLSKLTSNSFHLGLVFFFLVSAVTSIVLYDIFSSPTLQMSRTMRFLEHYGIVALLQQAGVKINAFWTLLTEWLKLNCPVYYSYVVDTMGPFMSSALNKTVTFVLHAENVTRPHRTLAVQKSWDFYYWIYNLSPSTWDQLGKFLWLALEILKDTALRLWEHSLHLFAWVHHWLLEHVLTGSLSAESIKTSAQHGLVIVQDYTVNLWNWCSTNIYQAFK